MTWLPVYVVFFLLIIGSGVSRSRTQKQVLMLAGSYFFYGSWGLQFLAILIASSVVNFAIGGWLRRKPTAGRLWVGILFNVALLSFFKYLPSISALDNIVMPIGVSFWTFQALSYLLDIYREEELNPTLVEFLLYLAFWPTVIMGPICRLSTLLPQFRQVRRVTMEDLIHGTRRIAAGLFMKLVLSEFLAPGVNAGFGVAQSGGKAMSSWSGMDVWFLAVGFGFQLFFDFAGYSNVVIGSARLFGFKLEENFDSPYLATTPSLFWTKWHMSLSSWIRDYLFVPLATLRRATWWRYFAVGFSMVIFGIWHGATLTYLVWGAYQGTLLVIHRIAQQLQRSTGIHMDGKVMNVVSWLCTFLSISLGWVAFRAESFSQAQAMARAVLSPTGYWKMNLPVNYYLAVVALAGGYFLYHGIAKAIRFTFERRSLFSAPESGTGSLRRMVYLFSENSWLWVTPSLAVLAILTALIIGQRMGVDVSPFVYARF